ncbi:MAG: TolB family protein [Planctomycetota bacterium]|jgi:hypothetical protein
MDTIQTSLDYRMRENPMGQARKDALTLGWNTVEIEVKNGIIRLETRRSGPIKFIWGIPAMIKRLLTCRPLFLLTVLCISVLPAGGFARAAAGDSTALLEPELLEGSFAGVDEIIFTVRSVGKDGHWYANFGYWSSNANQMMYGRDGSRLCALNLRTGRRRDILNDEGGTIRDPHVHYDGEKILFSYRKTGSIYFHLYEINADGTHLRQLTDGAFDDLEAIYLPDGGIMFCSSRCKRWVNCWFTQVAVLYRCDADGGNMRILSANIEQDNTPWMLPDGRVLYTRWEYVDRSRVQYHHLWSMNPDGTGQMIY